MGLEMRVVPLTADTVVDRTVSAVMFQYPDTDGSVHQFQTLVERAHDAGVSAERRTNFSIFSDFVPSFQITWIFRDNI